MICETPGCKHEVPDENIDRICAYQLDDVVATSRHGYKNYPVCSCCNQCRQVCHDGAINPQEE